MTVSLNVLGRDAVAEAVEQLRAATAAKKCWGCGCLHGSLDSIERAIPSGTRADELDAAIRAARDRLVDIKYECLGCEVCWPPLAMNALNIDTEACPTEQVEVRPGWPPLPGSYTTLRYHASVAICALTAEDLAQSLVRTAVDQIAIVGTVYTENLGIERIIQNIVANPNIRFLVVCGADSRRMIGHLPGQSLLALAQSGVDEGMRIIGARGRRPVLRNLSRDTIEHFRQSIEVVDMIGQLDASQIAEAARRCADRNPGPAATPPSFSRAVARIPGYVPEHMVSDPSGYIVIYPDCARGLLVLEHYRNDGALDVIIEGRTAAELYTPAVDRALVSRLDHAAYLGRELARAEQALHSGETYIQDAAAERSEQRTSAPCGCGNASPCADNRGSGAVNDE